MRKGIPDFKQITADRLDQLDPAVQACLHSGARRVLVVGVLHALTDELQVARVRVADDMVPFYGAPHPTWVVGALIEMATDKRSGPGPRAAGAKE